MRSGCFWGVSSDVWVLTVGTYKKRGRLETRSASRRHLAVENAFVSPIHRPNHHRTTTSIKFNAFPITYILHIQNGAILDRKQATDMQRNLILPCVWVVVQARPLNYSRGQITRHTVSRCYELIAKNLILHFPYKYPLKPCHRKETAAITNETLWGSLKCGA